jgi:hypothetical protein
MNIKELFHLKIWTDVRVWYIAMKTPTGIVIFNF